MACCAVKTLIKWPLVKLLQSIKSCKIYILYDTTNTIIEANSLQTAWTIFWSLFMKCPRAIIFFRQKGGISALSPESHHNHRNQQQCAQLSANKSSLPNAVQTVRLVHITSGVRKFYAFLL